LLPVFVREIAAFLNALYARRQRLASAVERA
jgi:hypothetical protein